MRCPREVTSHVFPFVADTINTIKNPGKNDANPGLELKYTHVGQLGLFRMGTGQ
jgi:hypothetical protein